MEGWHPGDQYARVVLIAEYKMTKKNINDTKIYDICKMHFVDKIDHKVE